MVILLAWIHEISLVILTAGICGLRLVRLKNMWLYFIILVIILGFFLVEFNFNNIAKDASSIGFTRGYVAFYPHKVSYGGWDVVLYSHNDDRLIYMYTVANLNVNIDDEIVANCKASLNEDNKYSYYGVNYVLDNCKIKKDEQNKSTSIIKLAADLRTFLMNRIDNIFKGSTANFIKGILIGETDGISKYQIDDYKNAGILHIMAVSGFNMSLMHKLISVFIKRLQRWPRWIISILLLFVYQLIVGLDNIPALRSFICFCLIDFALLIGRRPNLVYISMIAALVLILIYPRIYLSVSYQLSVAAGFAMTINLKRVQQSIVIFLFIAPVMAFHFGEINVIGLLSNIILLPLISPITYISIFEIVNPLAPTSVAQLNAFLINILNQATAVLAKAPPLNISSGNLIQPIFMTFALLIFIMVVISNYQKNL